MGHQGRSDGHIAYILLLLRLLDMLELSLVIFAYDSTVTSSFPEVNWDGQLRDSRALAITSSIEQLNCCKFC